MPQTHAKVVENTLIIQKGEVEQHIPLDSEAWYEWLETATSFSYRQYGASFTAQRRERKEHWYWYAYAKRDGRVVCVYLGRSDRLNSTRLTDAARKLYPWLVLPDNLASRQGHHRAIADQQRARHIVKQRFITQHANGEQQINHKAVGQHLASLHDHLCAGKRLSRADTAHLFALAQTLFEVGAQQPLLGLLPVTDRIDRDDQQRRHSDLNWAQERTRSSGELF